MVLMVIVPLAVAAARALAQDWVALGDNGYFLLRSRDVLTEHHPLLGTWTSASLTTGIPVNNPGPLLFDALALPAKLGGDAGLAVGVVLLNAVSIVGVALVARRQSGARGVVVAMAAAAALGWAMGSELLYDPWQPHSLLFPMLCFLMMAWGLACGDLALLPWAVGVGSLIVQTHIGYVFLVPAIAVWGVGVAGVRLWRARHDEVGDWAQHRQQAARVAAVSLLVAAVCWWQPIYEQLFGDPPGNLRRLSLGAGAAQDRIGWEHAPRYVAEVIALPPWWGRPASSNAFAADQLAPSLDQSTASLSSLSTALAGLAAVGGVLVFALVHRRQRRDMPGAWAAATGLVVMGVAVVGAAATPVGVTGIAPHHLRWLWPVAVFVTFAVALPVVAALCAAWGRWLGLGSAALAAVALTILNLPTLPATVGPNSELAVAPTLRELLPQLDSLRDERGVLVDMRGLRFAEPYSAPVMAELQRLGVPWFVEDAGMVRQVGASRAHHDEASVRLSLREGDSARQVPRGARRVAFVEGLTDEERAELEALRATLAPFIADGGLAVGSKGGGDGRTESEPTARQLRDADRLYRTRVLVDLVDSGRLSVPKPWAERLERYAELQTSADSRAVAVLVEPLGGHR
jgi:hypothetical protein